MHRRISTARVVSVVSVVLACATAGCHTPPAADSAAATYEPLRFAGHVVRFDALGLPYYDDNGVSTYVPRSDASFDAFVSHFRAHQEAYRAWEHGGGPDRTRAQAVDSLRPATTR